MSLREEMDINGYTEVGQILSGRLVSIMHRDIIAYKRSELAAHVNECPIPDSEYDTLRDLARFGEVFVDLIADSKINAIVNNVLNEKAIIFSFTCVIHWGKQTTYLGQSFHRDQAWLGGMRTAFLVMIPLVDFTEENGATYIVPGTHHVKTIPSLEFMNKHKKQMCCRAGEGFAVDACCWHRAGENRTSYPRPLIAINYQLAFMKPQIDYCRTCLAIENASPVVKQRLGYDVRVRDSYEDFYRRPDLRMWKPGMYSTKNCGVGDIVETTEFGAIQESNNG